jgi:DNA helicase-2/ATP-dependent DNA helicase PcrA
MSTTTNTASDTASHAAGHAATSPAPQEPISALEIARALAMFPPTAEQQAVIEAPLSPVLVVAGAGSGKTETMANRVLWLLANGLVRPDQILGLTFTRKAAGELGKRITDRITQLEKAGLMPRLGGGDSEPDASDLFNSPTVATYNSFASRLFSDNALLLGREPESVLLSETSAWLLARRVVIEHGDRRLVPFGKKLDAMTDAVLEFSRILAENPPPFRPGETPVPHDLGGLADSFRYLADLPYGNARKNKPYDSVVTAINAVAPLPVLAELASRYQDEKRRLGLIEFSDQVALALEVSQKVASVVEHYRDQYRVVLLDEYQDTSVLQTRLLSTLFAQHPVMAVGDPHQSIYGWRGASSANLLGFSQDFAHVPNTELPTMSLSYTWRNPVSVLDAANALVAPLSDALRARPGGIQVETLKVPDGKEHGRVDGAMFETIAEEAAAIARWFAERLPEGTGHSAAMLFRARRDMDFFAEVLREHGVRAHVLGIGGLLSTPEITDVVSTLRVVHDPSSGTELIRVLTGGRWRIGPRDLQALSAVAGWLAAHDWAQKAVSDELKAKIRASVAVEDTSSLVDALDFVVTAPTGHSQLTGFSEPGLERLRAAGAQLAWFRSRAGLPLLDFVRLVEQELLLDIELVANESRGLGLANLYAFHDAVSAFQDSDEQGTLSSFLRWLKRAELQDDMGPRSEPAEPGTVQLLTVHGAKGLEWDFVAIPALTENSVPAKAKEGAGWLRFGELPYPFRGDRDELPELRWRGLATQAEFDDEFKSYKSALGARHDAEERRLIYVATTRAQQQLMLTGSFWAAGKTERKPSRFLAELAEAGIIPRLPPDSATEEKPETTEDGTELWPFDPLGIRRRTVEAAADRVRQAAEQALEQAGEQALQGGSEADTPLGRDITLLLRERAELLAGAGFVPLPTRIPASRFKDYVDDPLAVAARLRRPMPERPYRATRLGTLFHAWVEQRSGTASSGDLIDAEPAERDVDFGVGGDAVADSSADSSADSVTDTEQEQLSRLKATFESSPWAGLKPEAVEIEIHYVLAGQVFICKLDAVYRTATGYQVVDWKTGKAPKDAADLELKQTQLALYRLAFAQWQGVDPEQVDAVFYFVADDTIITPERLYSEDDLVVAWSDVVAASVAPASPRRSAPPVSASTTAIGPVASSTGEKSRDSNSDRS